MRNAKTLVMNSGIEEEDLVFVTNIFCAKIVIIIIFITIIQVVMKMENLDFAGLPRYWRARVSIPPGICLRER